MNENKEIKKIAPLKDALVFKRVFSSERNEDILKALLESILDRKIQDVVVKNPELSQDLYDSNAGLLDIKAEMDNHCVADIKLQVRDLKNMDMITTQYLEAIQSSHDYRKNIIVINLLDFEFYEINSYHNIAHMKFEKTKEDEYVNMGYTTEDEIAIGNLEMHFIELPKFERKNPEANTPLEQWLWLLSGRKDKLEMAKKENKEIGKAIDIIKEMSMDEKEWELYMSRHMAIMDYNTGMLDARDEGEKLAKLKIAQNMLKKKIDVETIEEVTGLTKQEIENLIKDK